MKFLTIGLSFLLLSHPCAEALDDIYSPDIKNFKAASRCFQKKHKDSAFCQKMLTELHEEITKPVARIINGTDVPKDTYPWFAKALEGSPNNLEWGGCGGMLVAPDWVLTAAHCTIESNYTAFQIGALSDPIQGDNGGQYNEILAVDYVVEHPDYYYLDYDFALVKLQEKSSIAHIDMDMTGIADDFDENKTLWTLGFGESYYTGGDPDWLQHIDVSFVPADKCKEKYDSLTMSHEPPEITDNMLCVSIPMKGPCYGDSGGPLYDKENDKVVGIVSWGESCASPVYPGVYAKISNQVEWIQETICSDTTDVEILSFCEGYTNAPTISREPSISPTLSFAPSVSLKPTLSPTLSHIPTITCDDVPDWVDYYGFNCTFYDTEGYCENYGNYYPGTSGLTANDACCICGGGVGTYPTATPTISNAPTVTCDDVPDWVNSYNLGCDWYNSDYMCQYYGNYYPGTSGLTANDACCLCGGGVGTYPTATPTVSNAPTVTCDDVPYWIDYSGYRGCRDYNYDYMCQYYGIYSGTGGLTAYDACCNCGGGVGTYPTSAPTVACVDVPNWVDEHGSGCDDVYVTDTMCDLFGDIYEGTSGLTANDACCNCGGGLSNPTLSPVGNDMIQSKSSKSSKSSLKSSKSKPKSSKDSEKSKKKSKLSKSSKTV